MMIEDASKRHDEALDTSIVVRAGGRQWTIRPTEEREESRYHARNLAEPAPVFRLLSTEEPSIKQRISGLRRVCDVLVLWLDSVLLKSEDTTQATRHQPSVTPRAGISHALAGFRESFGWGIVLGLLLGCLCVIGIHATAIEPLSTVPHVNRAQAVKPTRLHTASFSGPSIEIPAIRLYGLYWRPTKESTQGRQSSWTLWRSAAYSSDLVRYESSWKRSHRTAVTWNIRAIDWNVHNVGTLSSTSRSTAMRVSAWLASEVSALAALDSSISDGEPGKDAWTAYQTARRMMPQVEYLQATGRASELERFQGDVRMAFVTCAHGQTVRAADLVTAALEDLHGVQ